MIITAEDLFKLQEEEPGKYVLLDVRSWQEFEDGHMKGSLNIPLQILPEKLDVIPKAKKIITICTIGARSAKAAEFLNSQGYNAFNLEGGLINWNNLCGPSAQ